MTLLEVSLQASTHKDIDRVRVRFEPFSENIHPASMHTLYRYLREIPEETLHALLRSYAPESIIEKIADIIDLHELAIVVRYVDIVFGTLYGKPQLGYMKDKETGKPAIITITLPNCDWHTWEIISKNVKKEMKMVGLDNTASKVAIICLEGLLEPHH